MAILISWNKAVFLFLFALGSATNVFRPFWALTASFLPYLLAAFYFLFLVSLRGFKARMYFVAIALLSVILSAGIATEVIRQFFPTARPFVEFGFVAPFGHDGGGSMPSRHMAFLVPLALSLFLAERHGVVRRSVYLWFGGLTFAVGFARVVLALHYPGDIIAGIVIGTASFFGMYALLPEPSREA